MLRRLHRTTFLLLLGIIVLGCSKFGHDRLPITTSSEEARSLFEEGMALADCYHHAEAQAKFRKAVELDPNFALGYLGLAFANTTGGEKYSSIVQADQLSQPTSGPASRSVGFGISLIGSGSSDAITEANKHIDRVSEGERLWIRGQRAESEGDQALAIQCFRDLAACYPRDARVHRLLGDCYFRFEIVDSSIASYLRALELDSTMAVPYNMLGYQYQANGNTEKADAMLRRYAELLPKEPNPADSYAEFLLISGRYKESLEFYLRALQLDSTFTNARVGIATNLMMAGMFEAARASLYAPHSALVSSNFLTDVPLTTISPAESRVSQLSPGEQRMLMFAEALSYLYQNVPDSAIAVLERRATIVDMKVNPIDATYDFDAQGKILSEIGRTEDAKSKFDLCLSTMALAKLPRPVQARQEAFHHARIGCWVALPSGDLESARAHLFELERAVMDSASPRLQELLHIYRGVLATVLEDYDLAVTELKQASQRDPLVLFHLGYAYEKARHSREAIEYYQKAAMIPSLNSLSHALVLPRVQSALARMTS